MLLEPVGGFLPVASLSSVVDSEVECIVHGERGLDGRQAAAGGTRRFVLFSLGRSGLYPGGLALGPGAGCGPLARGIGTSRNTQPGHARRLVMIFKPPGCHESLGSDFQMKSRVSVSLPVAGPPGPGGAAMPLSPNGHQPEAFKSLARSVAA